MNRKKKVSYLFSICWYFNKKYKVRVKEKKEKERARAREN
jgi:hypothetical protein